MQVLNQDLKTKVLKPVYLLYGEEEYLKTSYKKRFREVICGDDRMNYNYYEGKIDFNEVISQADTMPFFGDRRLLVIADTGFFKNSAPEQLLTYLPRIPETSCLLFVEGEVDKRNKLFKLVEKLGYACALKEQDQGMLAKWAAQYLTKAGKKIRGSTMNLLLEKTGGRMENILSELEKLIAYTDGREVVEDEDVEAICTVQAENKVFDMITQISVGNRQKAMDLYEDLLTLREPPMRILFLMGKNYNQILQTKELLLQGKTKSEIAASVGVPTWAAGKLMEQARHYTVDSAKEYLRKCLAYDEAIKTGNLSDRMAVELLLAV